MNQAYQMISAENFLHYNENNFAIEFLSKHINSDTFTSLKEDQKRAILKIYKEMLISKNFIDAELFHRQAQIPKNQILLKKLLKKFEALSDTKKDQQDIKVQIHQQTFWQNSQANLIKTNSPIETTNRLKAQISTVNMHRLDGVWSRNFTNIVLNYKQINAPVFSAVNAHVATLNGLTSYGFYLARGGMETAKFFKHGLSNHDFYSQKGISKLQQFTVQWNLRSSLIINDILLWAPVNAITYHFWLDMKGNILTAILLLGDLLHSMYNYYVCNQLFAYLQEKLNQPGLEQFVALLEKEHQTNLSKQKYFMSYQFLLLSAFSTVCGFFINWASSTQMSFALVGGLICFSIQFFVNLIESIFELKATEDDNQIKIIYFKMASRFLLQASIPALFIGSSFLLPMLELNLPTTFITLSLFALSAMMVKLSNDLNQLFEAYMTNYDDKHKTNALEALSADIRTQLDSENPNDFEINSKIEHWYNIYQNEFQKENAYQSALTKVQKDLAYGLSLISFITSATLILNASLPLVPVVLAILGTYSLMTANHIKAPEVDENLMTQTLNLQLKSV